MSCVWTIAEQRDGHVRDVSWELLARGRPLADRLQTRLAAVILGDRLEESSLQTLIHRGADVVYAVEHRGLAEFQCESYSAVLSHLVRTWHPAIILSAATSSGRTVMPHLAIRVDAGLTADCTHLEIEDGTDNLLQTRPAIGGNIMATIKTPRHRPQMATVRPRSTRPLPEDQRRSGSVVRVPVEGELEGLIDLRVQVLGYRRDEESSANLEEAEVVVAGGRGLKRAENFQTLSRLARRLGGEVGASREAVDRGWISYPHQVGLSGKTVSPRVYVAAGMSGSVQHLAGIKTAEKIVSINLDPEAPIHRVADLAVVGDLFRILPLVETELERRGNLPDSET